MDLKTIHAYNQQALKYDEETTDFWERFPRSFFDEFIKLSNNKVLDVGSGPGRDGAILKDAGLDVTCLDASESMVEICKSRGLTSVCADFNTIPFSDQLFDGVWAYTSLLHVPKSEVAQVMQEINRVIKKDGILGLGLIEGDTEGYKESEKVTFPRWFSYYAKDEVEQLLENHGFKVIYFETFKPSVRNYLNFIARKI